GGSEILFNTEVIDMQNSTDKITGVTIRRADGSVQTIEADYVISSLPVQNLFHMLKNVPPETMKIADGLMYRNFRSAALLLNKMKIKNKSKYKTVNGILPDTWTYIQESDVHVGRLQMYNNWSPYLVKNDNLVWIGLEYFCGDDDEIWTMPNAEFEQLAIKEGCKVGLIDEKDVLDITSEKLEKAYPAYFGTYNRFDELKHFTDKLSNLYLIGRNGMHKYINIDHVVLSGIAAADNIAGNMPDKENIWNIDLTKFLD
ncbi:MAG: FAD-dependent oxidoreductase, partial [Alphaproteobacteria bacterium]|nr:FAD-dependent oxidoreductase [Alphaproteobacteria bacterium]